MIGRLGDQLAAQGVRIELTEAGRDVLVEKGYDPVLGARPLRRAIQRYIEDKLSDAMLERQLPAGTVVLVDGEGEDTKLTVNGEQVGGSVELPMMGLDEPVVRGAVAPVGPAVVSEGPPDAGSAGASA